MEQLHIQLHQLASNIAINTVQLEDGHSLNSLWQAYGTEGVRELITNYQRKADNSGGLEIVNEHKIKFTGKAATYTVIGRLPSDIANMRVSIQVVATQPDVRQRVKVDLFDFTSIQYQCGQLAEKYRLDSNLLEADLIQLADLLESYRDSLYEDNANALTEQYSQRELTPKAAEKAMKFLSNPKLMENLDKLLEQSGIVGEESNRMCLLVIGSSYKMPNTLHGMVQAVSGAGKSHLINAVAGCMPQEDVRSFTRITSKSLYHYKENELVDKLIIIQDFDGLDEQADYAFREMQSYGELSSSTVGKDRFGNPSSKQKVVKGHFASLSATTKTEIYLDNASRCIQFGLDESLEQTQRIIHRQNQMRAGVVDADNEHEVRQLIRNCMRVLKKHDVVNPYADKLTLPIDARMLRRLNGQFQDFITQITLLHQYQRKQDDKGRLIATKDDIALAIEIFFDAILLKVDELDGSTRQFFETVKEYVKAQPTGSTYRFTQREIRQESKLGKATVCRYFQQLQELEYIQCVEGSVNRGFKYVVSYFDNLEKLKAKVRQELTQQLEQP